MSKDEKEELKNVVRDEIWTNIGTFEKLLRVQLFGYNGLEINEILDWLQIGLNKPLDIKPSIKAKFLIKRVVMDKLDLYCSGVYFYYDKSHRSNASKNINLLNLKDYNLFTNKEENIEFYIDRDYLPPFSSSSQIINEINEKLGECEYIEKFKEIKKGKMTETSEEFKIWVFNLRKNSEILEKTLCIFYNYWKLKTENINKKRFEIIIKKIYKTSPILFFNLLILNELVYQWDYFNLE